MNKKSLLWNFFGFLHTHLFYCKSIYRHLATGQFHGNGTHFFRKYYKMNKIILIISLIIPLATSENSTETCSSFSMTTNQNEFTSPWYPDNYPSNVQCTKLIEGNLF